MRSLKLVEEARRLRDIGWTGRAIATNLHIRPSTVSRWCGELKSNRVGKIVEAFQRKRQLFFDMDKIPDFGSDTDSVRLLAAMLYWCEGSKYPASNQLNFTCSDPDLMELFVKLFRLSFSPDETKFRVWLQIHDVQNQEDTINFWSKLLKIPQNQFMKPNITVRIGGRYRKIYYGTCSLRYIDYSKILRLMGLYSRFFSSFMGNKVK